MKNRILSSDISIVVQGPVYISDKGENYTERCCRSIRNIFPDSEIILSTWEGMDTKKIEFDKLILSKTLEPTYIVRMDNEVYLNTTNHQIITTLNGVKKAERKYTIKIRSDMYFINDNCLKYMGRFERHGNKEGWRVFIERVLCLPTYNPNKGMIYPYNICDWFFAGTTIDIQNLFDIPLQDYEDFYIRKNELYPRIIDNIGTEQYIWISCLRKNKIPVRLEHACCAEKEVLKNSEIAMVENFVLLSAQKMGVRSLKSPKSGYGAAPSVSQGLYTNCEWRRLYNKISNGDCFWIYNPFEDLVSMMNQYGRRFLERNMPEVYELVIKSIRKIRKKSI